MTLPRVVALDATSVTLADDPAGVGHELVLALLSGFGDSWAVELRDGTAMELQLGPALRAERVAAGSGVGPSRVGPTWRLVRDTGALLTLSFAEIERLWGDAWAFRHAFRREHFPLGATLDRGRYELRELLYGGPDRGLYRALDNTDGRSMLVTLGPPQRDAAELVWQRLAFAEPGIAKLRHIGSLATEGQPRYDGLVEEEPTGEPSSRRAEPWSLAETIAIGLSVAEVLRSLHARGACLGGLRPELVYLAGDALVEIAPRCEPFIATSEKRGYAVPPAFAEYYLSPEQLARGGASTPADDVFALAATMTKWHTGAHPFEGEYAANAFAIASGKRRWWRGAIPLEPMLEPALLPAPDRITLDELCELLHQIAPSSAP